MGGNGIQLAYIYKMYLHCDAQITDPN